MDSCIPVVVPVPVPPPLPPLTARMQASFDLNQFDDCILKQIVKKFTFRSGVNFYRSCRGAKEFVDRTKPVWDLPELYLSYEYCCYRRAYREEKEEFRLVPIDFTAEKFCRIGTAKLVECESDFIKETVLPELEALGSVVLLNLEAICVYSEEIVGLLLAAGKPKTVRLYDKNYDAMAALFKNVKNLEIWVADYHTYHKTKKIFQLARNRKTITLISPIEIKGIFSNFLENWRDGETIDTLERLTLRFMCKTHEKETMLQHMEDQLQTFVKTSEGYILEREFDRLCISSRENPMMDRLEITFHFSSLARLTSCSSFPPPIPF